MLETKRAWLPAALIIAAFVAIIVAKPSRQEARPTVGEAAPSEWASTPARRAIAEAKGLPVFLCFRSGVTQPGYCRPCQEMARITAELKPRFDGRAVFVDVSLDDDTPEWDLIEEHQVQVKPTNVLLDRDHNVVENRMGVWPAEELAAALEEVAR